MSDSNETVCDFVWQHEYHKRWVSYSTEEISILNKAVKQMQTTVSLPSKNSKKQQLVLDLEKMVQRNKVSFYEQRVRCLVPNCGIYAWLWKDENEEWCCYKPYMAFFLETAYQKKEKTLKFYDKGNYEINLASFEQINEDTSSISSVKREIVTLPDTTEIKSIIQLNKEVFRKMLSNEVQSVKRIRLDSSLPCTGSDSNVNIPSSSFNPMHIDDSSGMEDFPSSSGDHRIVPVDAECTERENYHIYCEGGDAFNATLNQTNLQNNNNKFYIIQLLEHNQKKQYAVFRRWGRVGQRGQLQFTAYRTSLLEAKDEFEKKFYDKTRNDWSDKKKFVHVPGKYDLLHMDLNPEVEVKQMKIDVQSKLVEEVQSLLAIICDQKRMEDIMKEMLYDVRKTPLGKLTLKQVQEGYIALNKIANVLSSAGGKGSALLNACNEFYTKIPHNFGLKIPPIIKTQAEVDEKLRMLEVLSNITVAMSVLKSKSAKIEHPLDRYYHSLNCSLELVNSTSLVFLDLEKCLQSTHGPTHKSYEMEIIHAFKCCKPLEESQYNNLGNNLLLWHGSRITNWLGILKEGLRIAPPEAPCTGYMFGKGIYFADVSSKSANYCFATKRKNEGILLLCEVSAGKQFECTEAEEGMPGALPNGYSSVYGKGRMSPKNFATGDLSSTAVAPFGPLVDKGDFGSLIYNEYIVYDVKQVRMRYLLHVKFNFK